jgi:hypothetical protein
MQEPSLEGQRPTKFIFTTAALVEEVAGMAQPVVVFGNDEGTVPSSASSATPQFSELLRTDPKDMPRYSNFTLVIRQPNFLSAEPT